MNPVHLIICNNHLEAKQKFHETLKRMRVFRPVIEPDEKALRIKFMGTLYWFITPMRNPVQILGMNITSWRNTSYAVEHPNFYLLVKELRMRYPDAERPQQYI